MDRINIACLAMNSTCDYERNFSVVESAIKEAGTKNIDFLFLPEMFPYIGDDDSYYAFAEKNYKRTLSFLKKMASENKVNIFAGTIPEPEEESAKTRKVYNTFYAFNKEGEILVKYRKIHLFHLNKKNKVSSLCESDWCLAGTELVSFHYESWHILPSICYDLRFPEMFHKLSFYKKPADLIVLPAAFTYETGLAHWHTLVRARAIENQCYMVAVNQVGQHNQQRRSFGHSLVVDPWGDVLLDTKESLGLYYTAIEKSKISKVRGKIPVYQDRQKLPYL